MAKSSFRLGYITDVEGNLDYFLRYVERSNVLRIESCTPQELILDLQDEESCHFVFGGDAVDKGPGDIRLCRALVALQQRYPDRVALLVGNRDLNKLRFMAELADDRRPASCIPPPHWDPSAPSLQQYLEGLAAETQQQDNITSLDTSINRLHYMLKHTLGCPNTFEFRREELGILRPDRLGDVSDRDVLQSFLDEIQPPDGSLYQYLSNAKVAVAYGNTLFCHGAVDQRTMRFVPSLGTKFENPVTPPMPGGTIVENVNDWIAALNEFLKKGLDDFIQRPYWNEDWSSRGGEALMALQNRPAVWGRSIVSNCYGDGGCIHTEHAARHRNDRVGTEPTDALAFEGVCSDPRDPIVADWLQSCGIQRIIVGHKPTGDCPAVLSSSYTGVEVVSADTSFSDTTASDNRGRAIGVVELVGASDVDNHLEVFGVLQDGAAYHSVFHRLHSAKKIDDSVGDHNLGHEIDGGWWVKAATAEGYVLTRGKGRNVEHKTVAVIEHGAKT